MTDARRALAFIFEGSKGLVEVAPQRFEARRCLSSVDELVRSADRWSYFGPLPRRRAGSRVEDVVDKASVLWVEFDADVPKGEVADVEVIVRLLRRVRERWEADALEPSVLWFSGNRGFHAVWKLDRPIPVEKAESFNRGLAEAFGGDHLWRRNGLLRLPGSVHALTGERAGVLRFSAETFDPDRFARFAELEPLRRPVPSRPASEPALASGETIPALYPALPKLSSELWAYIRARPERGGGYDRSAQEQAVITALVAQGWSDDEIFSFCSRERLPKFEQELRRGKRRWFDRSISNAREYLLKKCDLETFPEGGSTLLRGVEIPVGYTASDFETVQPDREYSWLPRGAILRMVAGQLVKQLVIEVRAEHDCSQRSVYNVLSQLEAGGYIERVRAGRTKTVHLTENGVSVLRRRDQLGDCLAAMVIVPTLAVLRSGGVIPVGQAGFSGWSIPPSSE